MDFETTGKSGNPFLVEDLGKYSGSTDPVVGGGGGGLNSNPFLSNSDFSIPAATENPFLSSMDGNEPSSFLGSGNSSTNPFAQFDYPGDGEMDTTASLNIFSAPEPDTARTNIFDNSEITNPPSDNFFGVSPALQPQTETKVLTGFDLLDDTGMTGPVENDFCKETDIFNSTPTAATDDSSRTSTPKGGPPRRPPPPRPIPPSKETKDLILSVTGAMEATSSHLLDRLQATRTPSPTPIRDLHSPSPTPDIPFTDLLGTDVTTGQLPAFPSNTEINLFGEEPIAEAPSAPKLPPRPAPPTQKPEPQQDIMDIFNADAPALSTVTAPQTNADILGLFDSSLPAAQTSEMTGTADLLLGDDFGGMVPAQPQEVNLLPVTAMELEPTVFPAQQQPDSLMATDMLEATEDPVLRSGDEFDAFAAKFENAAKEEGQEVCVVESDPFDPFSSSGLIAESGNEGESSAQPILLILLIKLVIYYHCSLLYPSQSFNSTFGSTLIYSCIRSCHLHFPFPSFH